MTKEEALSLFDAHAVFVKKPQPKFGTQSWDEWQSEQDILLAQVLVALKEHPSIEAPPPVIRGTFVPAKLITNEPPSPSK